MKIALLLAFAFAAFNTGLIWIVQVVHYPGFLKIGEAGYEAYQSFHMRSITWVVGPSMLLELLTSCVVLLFLRDLPWSSTYWVSIGLLILIWVNTAFFAAPTHGKLLAGFDETIIHSLININWWRTIAWTLRMVIIGAILYKA